MYSIRTDMFVIDMVAVAEWRTLIGRVHKYMSTGVQDTEYRVHEYMST